MLYKLSIIFWLSAVVLFTADAKSLTPGNQVKLTSHFDLTTCSSDRDKDILITIGMGNITLNNNFYAYDVLLKYDQNRVRFEGPIYLNTITEFMGKFKDVSVGHEDGYIRAFAYSDNRMQGNLEIVGFTAKLLDDCDEPLVFKIIEFDLSEDFVGEFTVDSVFTVELNKKYNPENVVEINFDREKIEFVDNEEDEISVSMKINPYKKLEDMFFEIKLDENSNFLIDNIESIDNNVYISSFNKITDDYYTAKLNFIDNFLDMNLFKLSISEIGKENYDIFNKININAIIDDNCHCFSEFKNAELKLVSKAKEQDTLVSVYQTKERPLMINYYDNKIVISNDEQLYLDKVEVYDILGNKVYSINLYNTNSQISLNTGYLNNGYYLIRMVTSKNEINKSIIIYN